jgi:hypothetical protein
MIYTARLAHLEQPPKYSVGTIIKRGDVVGRMGDSGAADGAHLHLDVVRGMQTGRYTLGDLALGKPEADAKQATLFIDDELFGVLPLITTYYADPRYYKKYAKFHYGYDVVPEDRLYSQKHFDIHWNRSMPGRVTKVYINDPGYGNCIQIAFEI